MLADRSWKNEAVLRLILSVVACVFLGSVLATAVNYGRKNHGIDLHFALVALAAVGCLVGTFLQIRREWPLEKIMRQVFLLLVCFYGGIILSAYAQKLTGPSKLTALTAVIAALSFQGGALLLVTLFLREHSLTWNQAFGFERQPLNVALVGVIAACFYLPVGWGLQFVSAQVMTSIPQFEMKPELQQSVQVLRITTSFIDRLAMGVVTIVLAPVAEEVLFRGILYPWIRQLGFPKLALWGSALLFALVHFNAVTFFPLFALALLLTFLYIRTGNLFAPIIAHSLFNALNFVTLFLIDRQKP